MAAVGRPADELPGLGGVRLVLAAPARRAPAVAAALAALAVAAGCRRATPTPTPAPSPTAAPATATAAPSPRPSATRAAPSAGAPTPTVAVGDAATPAVDAGTATRTPDADLPDAGALLDKRLEGGAVGGTYHLDDVRTGRHDGFTRIVWAMAEAEGAPRWAALLRRDVEGTAMIDLTLADVSAVDKPAEVAAQAVDSPIVDSVQPRRVPDDAVLAFRVRLAHPAGYRITVLEAPVRIVLDVAHGR